MFRKLVHKKRCLIPASGFYEWDKSSKPKQPYYFHLPNHELLAFAGLWDEKISKDGHSIFSCVLLTRQATPDIQAVHDRMPVILYPSYYEMWLNSPDISLDNLNESPSLSFYPVSSAVNSARIDDPHLIRPLT